jgi:hypothetical protein
MLPHTKEARCESEALCMHRAVRMESWLGFQLEFSASH